MELLNEIDALNLPSRNIPRLLSYCFALATTPLHAYGIRTFQT